MRPLWRNTLWLGFAAACGMAGAWAGWKYGTDLGISTVTYMHTGYEAQQGLVTVDLALDLLEQPLSPQRRRSADFQLRNAISYLGASTGTLQGWWTCPRSGSATLSRARAYLKTNPEAPSVFSPYPYVEEGLALCGQN